MWFSSDRTGFPLIEVVELGLQVHLLPVTKWQFERFLAEPNDFGDRWYEEALSVNPRQSYRRFSLERREGLLLSGVLPEEALTFARWLGEGFDLPTVAEWRAVYRALEVDSVPFAHLDWHLAQLPAAPARSIVRRLVEHFQPCAVVDLSLMRGGILEWVREGESWVGLGAPRVEVWPHLWDPLTDVIRPARPGERLRHFGFRLVRRR